jgi:integrase
VLVGVHDSLHPVPQLRADASVAGHYLPRGAIELQAAGTAWSSHEDLVFTTRWGEPLYPDSVTALMSKLIREHNKPAAPDGALPHARLHDLRHLHATTLLLAGIPEMPRVFRTVHPLGWVSGKAEFFDPTEQELLT